MIYWNVYRLCNKYIDDNEPWILKDETKVDRLKTVLYNLCEAIRYESVLLQAFLPDTAEEIFKQLNTNKKDYKTLDKFGYYEANKIGTAKIIFAKNCK
jgi:methionyl-tRNA synthetase